MMIPVAIASTVDVATPIVNENVLTMVKNLAGRLYKFYPCSPCVNEVMSVDSNDKWLEASYGAEILLDNFSTSKLEYAQRQAPQPTQARLANGNGNEMLTFTATKMVGSMAGGKTYWNVIGPRFPQYGVRIWPEKIKEAGIDEDQLDPSQEYPLDGYTATYIEKEKDGKIIPDKIISLTKVV